MKYLSLLNTIILFLIIFFVLSIYSDTQKLNRQIPLIMSLVQNNILDKIPLQNNFNLYIKNIDYIVCSENMCIIPKASGLPADPELTCIWNYVGGNGAIPGMEITRGWLPSIKYDNSIYNLSVLCRDFNGNIYYSDSININN